MKKKFIAIFLSFLSLQLFFSETNENSLYKIETVHYSLDNAFHEKTLIKKIPIDREKLFTKEDLEKYLETLEKKFLDTRLIDRVKIDYEISNENSIRLFIKIQKSSNCIIFPYPKYDSNNGFSLKAKLKNFNAFKRMEEFAFDFSYSYTNEKTNAIESQIDFIYPFYLGKTINKTYSNIDLFFDTNKKDFDLDSTLGIDFSIPFEIFSINLFFEEQYLVKDETCLNHVIGIFFPISLKNFIFKPGFNFQYSNILEPSFSSLSFLIPNFGIESKKISYIENFRSGYDLFLETKYSLLLETKTWNPELFIDAKNYFPFYLFNDKALILISNRLLYYFNNEKQIPMGFYIRGILDDNLESKHALILSNDFTFKIFNSKFNNKNFSKLNFEFQTGLFFDTSLVFEPEFIFDQTLGMQIIVQPEAMKSVQGRISVAGNFDWTNPKKQRSSGIEIYIGIGLFY